MLLNMRFLFFPTRSNLNYKIFTMQRMRLKFIALDFYEKTN